MNAQIPDSGIRREPEFPGKSAPRVLCVTWDLGVGGAARAQLELTGALAMRDFKIKLYALRRDPGLAALMPRNLSGVYWGVDQPGDLKPATLRILKSIVALARDSDVVFGMQDLAPIYFSVIAGALARRPVVGWVHTVWSHLRQRVSKGHAPAVRALYPRAKALIANSGGVARDLKRYLPRAAARIEVVPPALSIENIIALGAGPLPEVLRPVFRQKTVLSVGRLVKLKGLDVLLRAFARVRVCHPDANLVIVGEGPELPALEQLAFELALTDVVTFAGQYINPYPCFRRASMFVLSSQYEGFGLVLVEALAFGLPIVAADCEYGPREILNGGEYGCLVAPGAADQLGQAISNTLSSLSSEAKYAYPRLQRARTFDIAAQVPRFAEILRGASGGI